MPSPSEPRPAMLDLGQALGLRPQVRPVLARIRRRLLLMRRLQSELTVLRVISDSTDSANNPDVQEYVEKSVRFHRLRGQVDALEEKLSHWGCLVREDDLRHIDFKFMRHDGVAVLCWRVRDEQIAHWHHLDEDHDCRRPLDSPA